ncbi:hypothetical protein F511_31244 [Dorcoceras hygrometricum]|uniref:Uncharacterized protein n=1 Tax=Dorcoceras hygrometricum TaxID=472368 RepID=A0A2Z7BLZ4_9LAMI|nr:hypothetical protein F511_31244 [Dorcoceras hygrometricum]
MAGLAMETSKTEPADRNQAKSMFDRDAYVDSFPYVESYMDINPYVESSVNRYAYVEVQLYLLLVASRTEKSDEAPGSDQSRGNRHFTVGGGRLRQSGPRPEWRLLRQPTLEGLMRSARTETPRKVGRNKFRRGKAAAAARETGGGREVREEGGGVSFLGDTASRGPTTIVAPESQFRTCPSDHGKSV